MIVIGDGWMPLGGCSVCELCLCDKWRAVSCRSSAGKNVQSVCRVQGVSPPAVRNGF